MRIATLPALGLTIALSATAVAAQAASLKEAADALGAAGIKSIEYSGTGRWFQFGQAPAPSLPWPPFDVSRYVANVDSVTAAAAVQIVVAGAGGKHIVAVAGIDDVVAGAGHHDVIARCAG